MYSLNETTEIKQQRVQISKNEQLALLTALLYELCSWQNNNSYKNTLLCYVIISDVNVF